MEKETTIMTAQVVHRSQVAIEQVKHVHTTV